ncbi:hypothetical protein HPB48_022860 [Haemaphysalis longicornis]|uniref:Endonuclease/exonuclease/phosphatase domain-containing protein n=1 Tax=Haemaphysalis longicornis TaxID=44386 RepID=A0A9J6FQ52_HAELO|nr:hypothetical protein HPB48_022860 [Haemaphysalis longicornis]
MFALNAVAHCYVVVEQLATQPELLLMREQRQVVTELTLHLLANEEPSDFDACRPPTSRGSAKARTSTGARRLPPLPPPSAARAGGPARRRWLAQAERAQNTNPANGAQANGVAVTSILFRPIGRGANLTGISRFEIDAELTQIPLISGYRVNHRLNTAAVDTQSERSREALLAVRSLCGVAVRASVAQNSRNARGVLRDIDLPGSAEDIMGTAETPIPIIRATLRGNSMFLTFAGPQVPDAVYIRGVRVRAVEKGASYSSARRSPEPATRRGKAPIFRLQSPRSLGRQTPAKPRKSDTQPPKPPPLPVSGATARLCRRLGQRFPPQPPTTSPRARYGPNTSNCAATNCREAAHEPGRSKTAIYVRSGSAHSEVNLTSFSSPHMECVGGHDAIRSHRYDRRIHLQLRTLRNLWGRDVFCGDLNAHHHCWGSARSPHGVAEWPNN